MTHPTKLTPFPCKKKDLTPIYSWVFVIPALSIGIGSNLIASFLASGHDDA